MDPLMKKIGAGAAALTFAYNAAALPAKAQQLDVRDNNEDNITQVSRRQQPPPRRQESPSRRQQPQRQVSPRRPAPPPQQRRHAPQPPRRRDSIRHHQRFAWFIAGLITGSFATRPHNPHHHTGSPAHPWCEVHGRVELCGSHFQALMNEASYQYYGFEPFVPQIKYAIYDFNTMRLNNHRGNGMVFFERAPGGAFEEACRINRASAQMAFEWHNNNLHRRFGKTAIPAPNIIAGQLSGIPIRNRGR